MEKIYVTEHEALLTDNELVVLNFLISKYVENKKYTLTYETVIDILWKKESLYCNPDKKHRLSACKLITSMQKKGVLHRDLWSNRQTDSQLSVKLEWKYSSYGINK